jgi:hypothetical protein
LQLAAVKPNETRHATTIEQLRVHRRKVIGNRFLSLVQPAGSRDRRNRAARSTANNAAADPIDDVGTRSDRWFTRSVLGLEFLVLVDTRLPCIMWNMCNMFHFD